LAGAGDGRGEVLLGGGGLLVGIGDPGQDVEIGAGGQRHGGLSFAEGGPSTVGAPNTAQ